MHRILTLLHYCARFVWHKAKRDDKAVYDVVFEAVGELGGVYVKLLQFLSLRVGLFPDAVKLRFLTFYDQVKVDPINLHDILWRELGNEKLQRFQSIEAAPFASGTFGQVYKGVLTDGRAVVVKVKRPNLEKALKVDFLLIHVLGRIFDLLYEQRFVHIPRLIKEFQEITTRELNYTQEVENACYLYAQYKNHPVLTIPYTYRELSTNTIIVQEYIGGIAMTDLLRLKAAGSDAHAWVAQTINTDLRFIMKRVSYDCLWQIFTLDKFFSDPHPGNIKVLPNNRYAFIDFGIMEPSPSNKRDYFHIIKYLSEGADKLEAKALGEALLSIGSDYLLQNLTVYDRIFSDTHETLKDSVLSRYGELIDSWRGQFKTLESGQAENYTKVWLDLFSLGDQFHMRLPKGVFSGLRASALITSFTGYLDPTYHFMHDIYKDVTRDVQEHSLARNDTIRDMNIERAIEGVTDWFASLAESDLMLYRDVTKHKTFV